MMKSDSATEYARVHRIVTLIMYGGNVAFSLWPAKVHSIRNASGSVLIVRVRFGVGHFSNDYIIAHASDPIREKC